MIYECVSIAQLSVTNNGTLEISSVFVSDGLKDLNTVPFNTAVGQQKWFIQYHYLTAEVSCS